MVVTQEPTIKIQLPLRYVSKKEDFSRWWREYVSSHKNGLLTKHNLLRIKKTSSTWMLQENPTSHKKEDSYPKQRESMQGCMRTCNMFSWGGVASPKCHLTILFFYTILHHSPRLSRFHYSINHINNPLRPISWLNMGSFLLFPKSCISSVFKWNSDSIL